MDRITHQPPRQQDYGSTSSLSNDSLKHTRKHERRKKESNQRTKLSASGGLSGQALADCPQRPRGQSGQVSRTVRKGHADRLTGGHGPSVKDNRTTRTDTRKTDRPRRPGGPSARVPDRPLLKLGPSTNRLQRKPKTKSDRKRRRARTRRIRDELHPRGPSANTTRTVRPTRTDPETARPRRSTPPIHHRISQMVEAVETRVWGHEKRQPRMLYPKNFAS
jgi:hypothetical protein